MGGAYLDHSEVCTGTGGQGQDGGEWPLCDSAGGQDEEEDKDHRAGTQPRVERDIRIVSHFFLSVFSFLEVN